MINIYIDIYIYIFREYKDGIKNRSDGIGKMWMRW